MHRGFQWSLAWVFVLFKHRKFFFYFPMNYDDFLMALITRVAEGSVVYEKFCLLALSLSCSEKWNCDRCSIADSRKLRHIKIVDISRLLSSFFDSLSAFEKIDKKKRFSGPGKAAYGAAEQKGMIINSHKSPKSLHRLLESLGRLMYNT